MTGTQLDLELPPVPESSLMMIPWLTRSSSRFAIRSKTIE